MYIQTQSITPFFVTQNENPILIQKFHFCMLSISTYCSVPLIPFWDENQRKTQIKETEPVFAVIACMPNGL